MKTSTLIKAFLITACFVGLFFLFNGYSRAVVLQATVFSLIFLPTLLIFHPFFENQSGFGWFNQLALITVATLSTVTLINWVFRFQPSMFITLGGISASWFVLELINILPLQWLDNLLRRNRPAPRRVLIVGAGEAGEMVAHELSRKPELNRTIVGFVDDDPDKRGSLIGNTATVVGKTDQVSDVCDRFDVDEVIIAIPSAGGELIRSVTRQAERMNANLRIVPGIREIIEGDVHWNQIRSVRPEDLLGRETVKIDRDNLRDYLRNKTVLITGAAGSIGEHLVRNLMHYPVDRVIGFDQDESGLYEIEASEVPSNSTQNYESLLGDVRDERKVKSTVKQIDPDTIIHAAAFKHVPMMERFPSEALKTNLIGSYNVFDAAQSEAKECIFISTDKAVSPKNIMGLTKRLGEFLVGTFQNESTDTRYGAVRFGNVLGSRGSVVPLFKRQIEEGGPVTVTDPEAVRYFMTPGESVKLILTSLSMSHQGMIYVLSLGDPIRIMDLARQLISLSGYQPETEIPIEITGLREGEKQKEKLFMENEVQTETNHPDITKVPAPALEPDQVNDLINLATDPPDDRSDIESRLRELIGSA